MYLPLPQSFTHFNHTIDAMCIVKIIAVGIFLCSPSCCLLYCFPLSSFSVYLLLSVLSIPISPWTILLYNMHLCINSLKIKKKKSSPPSLVHLPHNTNHLANSLDQRRHVLATTFAHSRGSASDRCMRECSHLNWAIQSHVDPAGASSALFSGYINPPILFLLPFFIFLPLPSLANLSHPPTSAYQLGRIRERNNVLRRIICSIKPNHISADSFFTQVGALDQLDECLMKGCYLTPVRHFSTPGLHMAAWRKSYWT